MFKNHSDTLLFTFLPIKIYCSNSYFKLNGVPSRINESAFFGSTFIQTVHSVGKNFLEKSLLVSFF
jgi:hypothetical protein